MFKLERGSTSIGETMDLTPKSFACDPVRVDCQSSYEHSSQTASVSDMSATTFRATQTFDHKGNPKDSDND